MQVMYDPGLDVSGSLEMIVHTPYLGRYQVEIKMESDGVRWGLDSVTHATPC